MKKLIAFAAIFVVAMSLAAEDAFARRGGGQRGMQGGQSANSYRYNYQTWGMQQQFQNQYRNRYGGFGRQNGPYQYQPGPHYQGRLSQQGEMQYQMNGPHGGKGNKKRLMHQQGMQNGAHSGQPGNGAQNGAGQKQMNQEQLRKVQPNGENQ